MPSGIKFLFSLFLILSFPSLIFPNESSLQQVAQSSDAYYAQQLVKRIYLPFLQVLKDLDDEVIEEKYTKEQQEAIYLTLLRLIELGTTDEKERAEVQELIDEFYLYGIDEDEEIGGFQIASSDEDYWGFRIAPSGDIPDIDLVAFKTLKRLYKKGKNFCKKHPMLCGFIGTVAAGTVLYASLPDPASGSSTSDNEEFGILSEDPETNAFAYDLLRETDRKREAAAKRAEFEEKEAFEREMSIPAPQNEASVSEILSEDLKKTFGESFKEKLRETSSVAAHEVLNLVAGFGEIIPEAAEPFHEIKDIFSFEEEAPSGPLFSEESPSENYSFFVAKGHELIDKMFQTDIAELYTEEAQANNPMKDVTVAVIPLPVRVPEIGRIIPSQALDVKGWKVGESIRNLTNKEKVPKWSTVRKRYWKNKAFEAKSSPSHGYEKRNLKRMEKGLAPLRENKKTGKLESKELHHIPPQREGGLFDIIEVWPDEHSEIDPLRHIGK